MPTAERVRADAPAKTPEKTERPILFQTYFKSGNSRTYAAQIKEATTGNHFLVLTDGRRDAKSGELRTSRLFIFSEDFPAFFKMLQEAGQFIRDNPVPEAVRQRNQQYRTKRQGDSDERHEQHVPARSGG